MAEHEVEKRPAWLVGNEKVTSTARPVDRNWAETSEGGKHRRQLQRPAQAVFSGHALIVALHPVGLTVSGSC
jgi:hypothetical protein